MTALVFVLRPDVLRLAMDSGVLHKDQETGLIVESDQSACTKAFVLPHLDGIMCGTGSREFVLEWLWQLQCKTKKDDSLLALDSDIPGWLEELAESFDLDECSTTIYHFAVDREASQIRGFAYRSTDNFATSEVPPSSMAIKPPDGIEEEAKRLIDSMPFEDAALEIMKIMRNVDESKPEENRVGIGGRIHYFIMQPQIVGVMRGASID